MDTFLFCLDCWMPLFVKARAWSPVFCMAGRRNPRIKFAAVLMANLSWRQRISFKDILAHPEGRSLANIRYSDRTCIAVSSRARHRRHTAVADQLRRARSDRSMYFTLAREICTASLLCRPCK
ncbi:hypothetical protein PoB_005561400 [Plakobranchus ocellatus]|uniref:Secreted protein n=1 Tax=Plakobranchus ocellatus TaxID=259542 RepID=A0AAV4CDA7_9GAST|nr:hypothetical protein PoB_005561400 [Plakobranchus ocellatus]